MEEIEKRWDYKYPGEQSVTIKTGDNFKISRRGESGKRFESSWTVVDILDEQRISEVGIVAQKVIVAKLNGGKYVDEWGMLRDIGDRVLRFDDYTIAHRLRAEKTQAA